MLLAYSKQISPLSDFLILTGIILLSVGMHATARSLEILCSRDHLHPDKTGQQIQRYYENSTEKQAGRCTESVQSGKPLLIKQAGCEDAGQAHRHTHRQPLVHIYIMHYENKTGK